MLEPISILFFINWLARPPLRRIGHSVIVLAALA
jgi:hypothetical protein